MTLAHMLIYEVEGFMVINYVRTSGITQFGGPIMSIKILLKE